jgi:hypothetical protein
MIHSCSSAEHAYADRLMQKSMLEINAKPVTKESNLYQLWMRKTMNLNV